MDRHPARAQKRWRTQTMQQTDSVSYPPPDFVVTIVLLLEPVILPALGNPCHARICVTPDWRACDGSPSSQRGGSSCLPRCAPLCTPAYHVLCRSTDTEGCTSWTALTVAQFVSSLRV